MCVALAAEGMNDFHRHARSAAPARRSAVIRIPPRLPPPVRRAPNVARRAPIDVKAEFDKRVLRQLAVSISAVGLAFLPMLMEGREFAALRETIGPYRLIAILLLVGFSFWNWRCPACSAYLGKRSIYPQHCRSCSVELHD